MSPPQGLATFPGVDQLVAASFSIAHGISPGTATLTIAPQTHFTTDLGTLSFTFGDERIDFVDCKVSQASFQRNDRGEIWRLSVLDRRWRWRFGQISGKYNVWRDNFTLDRGENGTTNTERTPQQLAALCLDAMGESGYDVADMPNDTRPSVTWNTTVPAQALASLCDLLGCRVVLQLDGRVAVRRRGVGAALTVEGALENDVTIDPPELPDAIAVACGPTRHQVDFLLEAVGIEKVDGDSNESLKKIDDLSYKPAGGWSHVDFPFYHQVAAASRELAKKSVFRYYRIQVPVDVPGYLGPQGPKITRLEQLVPIEDEQVALVTENSRPSNRPAMVYGVWYPDTGDMANTALSLTPVGPAGDSGAPSVVFKGPYSIDVARGLVIFEEPMYRNLHESAASGSGYEVVPGAAKLVLRTACQVRDAESLVAARYERTRLTGSQAGPNIRYLDHPEMVRTFLPTYSAVGDDSPVDALATNQADVDRAADFVIDAALLDYQVLVPQTVHYGGLVRVELDGAIQQITFSLGAGGTTTTACRNSERWQGVLPYRERRRMELELQAQRARRTREVESKKREANVKKFLRHCK